jgi:hypothetical protein
MNTHQTRSATPYPGSRLGWGTPGQVAVAAGPDAGPLPSASGRKKGLAGWTGGWESTQK